MSLIHFVKYQSLENDFCLIELRRKGFRLSAPHVAEFCHRRRGVGADGLIILGPEVRAGVKFTLYNADGSKAEWSGNGVRCAATHLTRRKHAGRVTLLTGAGAVEAVVRRENNRQAVVSFQRPMPIVSKAAARPMAAQVGTATGPIRVDAGNPHWIYLVRSFHIPWEAEGERLQRYARSTHGVNIEFVRVQNRQKLEMRIYERGVGPTASSGSGALAAVAACWKNGLIARRLTLTSPGGRQSAKIDVDTVELTATAHFVCAGEWQAD